MSAKGTLNTKTQRYARVNNEKTGNDMKQLSQCVVGKVILKAKKKTDKTNESVYINRQINELKITLTQFRK